MPRKLSPEEAAVMIIRRRLQQMEEDRMASRERDDADLKDDVEDKQVRPSGSKTGGS
jgi:hypothetical protein